MRFYKAIVKNIFVFFLVSFFVPSLAAQDTPIDKALIDLSNEVIVNIYRDIAKEKDWYVELKDFNEKHLLENTYGIYAIHYRYDDVDSPGKKQSMEFGVTILKMEDDNIFHGKGHNVFDLGFPLLNLKISGYQVKSIKNRQFDFQGPLQKHGQILLDEQAKKLPFQMSLESAQKYFFVGEEIEFTVKLKNISDKNLQVVNLNEETLFCEYNEEEWGKRSIAPAMSRYLEKTVLDPDKSINKILRIPSLQSPQEFEIYCSYGMTHKGVSPFGTLKIKVVKDVD